MERSNNISRKDFLKSSALAMAGITLTPTVMSANTLSEDKVLGVNGKLILKNVRLETGFEYEEGEVISTKTDLFLVETENGKITKIAPNNPKAKAEDAKGFLMLPAFKDMHIHLDKTFYGDKWQAVRKRKGGVKGMISLEEQIMPEILKNSTYKAEKMIELIQSKGTAFARSHVNIEPTSRLDSLKNLQKALDNKKKSFGAEIVAFPQHGVFYKNSVPYLKEAAQMNIDFIGGVDPYTIDGVIEKTIDFTVQLALDHQKGIDIHLHETGESGLKTVEYLIDKVNENPSLKGKTFFSHCFILGKLDKIKQEEIAEKLGNAQVGIASTIPIGNLIMPLPTLQKHNVTVYTGNDSIVDHWNTYGTGSVLEKANLYAQLYGQSTEFLLSRSLKLATANLTPLDDKGVQQWPKTGNDADFVLLNASCSAEAVSRISNVESLIYRGNVVF
ncbi:MULTISPECIES: amidohydrolase [Chryseobacterium]|uniref:amidohydrolase n=1 Tax=Chryseobacterium TaxID=59732 RepID=UPI00195D9534|nr:MULTISPECIES: amidohydrolase [Chryseobacterium]MBM7421436.1 cytosine/adenosine deaminase-related metal-dependent hydrolase [Chryseobacterium sp. JUb44]MDH6211399.1 cytosine/adenosine deaminase-related metal-dependent hydrolase [Chryseobacterium sp. BIGb0186]WSO10052.1 amidohydrolase [Chryseobacterium scophthalmum]